MPRQQGRGHFPKLLWSHQATVDYKQLHAALFQVLNRPLVRERGGALSELHERRRKETAVAVDQRLPVPRAFEHVETVVDGVQRVGLREWDLRNHRTRL